MDEIKVSILGQSFSLGDTVTVVCKDGPAITGELDSYCDAFNGATDEDEFCVVSGGITYGFAMSEIASIKKVQGYKINET